MEYYLAQARIQDLRREAERARGVALARPVRPRRQPRQADHPHAHREPGPRPAPRSMI
ncbi:MAG: hypothetical protein Kow0010_24580 [Dehalococcoidia bacterium]